MENNNSNNPNPDQNKGKLVTVAIHTYEKAQILRSILESEGIPVMIESIAMIQPVVPGNVRVRINVDDLPKALDIIEQVDFAPAKGDRKKPVKNEILVPVDFSSYSMLACEFAFRLAKDMDCKVKLMHAFFAPFYPSAIPLGDSITIQSPDRSLYKEIRDKMEIEMVKLTQTIDRKIETGELPNVSYNYVLVEGLPEEEIIAYSKKMNPFAIVMGTRGKSAKDLDLIGSVTAETIEGCRTPLFAIPEGTKLYELADMKHLVFLTNFRDREFKTFETMMRFFKEKPVKVHLAHITKKEDVWDEIRLAGLKKYLKEHYPTIETEYAVIDRTEGLEQVLDKFVKDNNIDLIAMSSSRRTIFARMFNPGIARRMLFHSDTPLLVIKGTL